MADARKRILGFLLILLGVVALNAAISWVAGLFLGRGAPEARYTREHFVWPALPGGIMADFGTVAVAAVLMLASVFLFLLLLVIVQLPNASESPPASGQGGAWMPSAWRKPFWIVLAGGLAALIFIHTLNVQPMGAKNRLTGAVEFIAGFNYAVAHKARFDEKGYEAQMLSAFMFSREDFWWFAYSGYWARYGSPSDVRWTDRKKAAADFLYAKFKEGALAEGDMLDAIHLLRETGDVQRVKELEATLFPRQ